MEEVYRIIANMIDTHAHVAAEEFDGDRDALIAAISPQGLSGWIEVGTSTEESKQAVELARQHANIYASVGVHPDGIASIRETDWATLEHLATDPKVCAIGEVGFDTYRTGIISEQEPVLRKFIDLAQRAKKPLIFHVRSGNGVDAHAELLRVLRDYSDAKRPKGVIHTFSGTLQQAQEYIALGLFISFSGVVTFKNAEELREIAKTIPLESILVETDCPYLTPEPYRGKRNEPSYVRYTIEKIAALRDISFEEVERAVAHNTHRLFGLDFS
jgi:TatD DNase family protein